ncbi:phosphatidylserine decarboxylase [Agarilytica rhodophyticola]|uniref:phosphatidylserine decarboxylase n=1 Tax=Agarilytica rhodophyticola TaxID=1737490 RepID=UPI000B347E83|nr:phosphatidylserine decarboxylase [Agarilytica rhodophyticola]
MAQTLAEWSKSIDPKISDEELLTERFFKDPFRSQYISPYTFFSPADGIILYQKYVENTQDPIIDIKGNAYTLADVMGDDEFSKPALVIGIFMTIYDVHINRVPYAGMLRYRSLPPLSTDNFPMIDLELDLLDKIVNTNNMGYLHNNQRMLNTIYSPVLDHKYHVIQIADQDVRVITPFETAQNNYFAQNERFSMIRWGSQTELIIPLDSRFELKLLQEDNMHVRAGIDPLVEIVFPDENLFPV